MVGVLDAKTDVQYNFRFSDGTKSEFKSERALTQIDFAAEAKQIKSITLWYNESDAMLFGFEIFDSSGK